MLVIRGWGNAQQAHGAVALNGLPRAIYWLQVFCCEVDGIFTTLLNDDELLAQLFALLDHVCHAPSAHACLSCKSNIISCVVADDVAIQTELSPSTKWPDHAALAHVQCAMAAHTVAVKGAPLC